MYICILISLMNLMGEFPKKSSWRRGKKGVLFLPVQERADQIYMLINMGGNFDFFVDVINVDPIFYLSFVSKFHINHIFTVILHESIGSFGNRPPWRVKLTVTTDHNFVLLFSLGNNVVLNFYIMLLSGWNGIQTTFDFCRMTMKKACQYWEIC